LVSMEVSLIEEIKHQIQLYKTAGGIESRCS
jgi:hypothetical protein